MRRHKFVILEITSMVYTTTFSLQKELNFLTKHVQLNCVLMFQHDIFLNHFYRKHFEA